MVLRWLNGLIILKCLQQSFALLAATINNFCDVYSRSVAQSRLECQQTYFERVRKVLQRLWILKGQEEFFRCYRGLPIIASIGGGNKCTKTYAYMNQASTFKKWSKSQWLAYMIKRGEEMRVWDGSWVAFSITHKFPLQLKCQCRN